jgi:hypothetical protein
LAKYHANAMDNIGSLYFTKEAFDNLSPIYGSTYPDFYGAVGVTFEQGSSRGLVQESESGLVTFPFTIHNQLTTGLATINGAVNEKINLFKLQKSFFQSALDQAKTNKAKAFIFGDSRDETLTQRLLELVLRHKIKVYQLTEDQTLDGKKFEKGKAYIVPALQPNFRIVHSVFEETVPLSDSTYYDNTSWSIAHAYGLQYVKISNAHFSLGDQVLSLPEGNKKDMVGKSNYAYLLSWADYNSSKALYYLLDKGVIVKAAYKTFTANTDAGNKDFGYGSLIIPVSNQIIDRDSLYEAVQGAAKLANVRFLTTNTGFSIKGIDLGSNNIKTIKKPQVALFSGAGVNAAEVGEVWFLLNFQLNLPVTKLDINSLSRTDLQRYNTLILSSGNYNSLNKEDVSNLKTWVKSGGVLITFRSATEWAIKEDLVKEVLYSDSIPNDKKGKERVDYVLKNDTETAKRINGGIFLADIDITNPIGFGLNNRNIYITKTGSTILQESNNKYATVAKYSSNPYISGYVSKENISKIKDSAAILVSSSGRGNVILFSEDPVYRHYWHGTDRLLINSVFFGNQLSGGRLSDAEE